jgi:ABC-type phosphate/phosphonate transport system substrate-binding protein
MIASLPMYDWPEVRDATDAWWNGLARHIGVAGELSRIEDYASLWRDPDLILSQTCGYPFTHEFRNRLTLIATPHYGVDGCEAANYCSIVFARHDAVLESFRGATAAVNTPDSMSGMLALQLVFAPLARAGSFFGSVVWSGGHLASLAAVREGKADVCAIDAVCVGLARRYRPRDLEGLVEIARSPLVPGLPYVTNAAEAGMIRRGVLSAFADPSLQAARDHLFLSGVSMPGPSVYDRILDLEARMKHAGGLKLP